MMLTACFLLSFSVLALEAQEAKESPACAGTTMPMIASANSQCKSAAVELNELVKQIRHASGVCEGNGCGNIRNLAAGKPARQSSLYTGLGTPNKAVDNIWNPFWAGRSCTHTKRDHNPWWEVDLGKEYNINNVMILNRQDCCSSRLHKVKIWVGNDRNNMKACNYYDPPVTSMLSMTCTSPMRGRYVKIQMMATMWLHICEVAVLGN